MGFSTRMPADTTRLSSNVALALAARFAPILLVLGFLLEFDQPARAASPLLPRKSLTAADTSNSARRDALKSIPLDKLDPADRAKVVAVLSNVSVFRRMPVKVIDCDPDMYLFLVRHPDVVVNIWELLKISKLRMRQTGERRFSLSESVGATISLEFVHQSHDTHVIYGEGTYLLHHQPIGLFLPRRTDRGRTVDQNRLAPDGQNGRQQLRPDRRFSRHHFPHRRGE